MKTKGTLVVLTPGFAASEEDSTCLPMQQSLIRTLGDIYPQLKIIVLSFQYPYEYKKYTWHQATVYSFNGRNKGGIHRLLLRRKIIDTLLQIHRAEKIVGLLSFWYGECAAIGKIVGRKYNIKHCCWLLGQDARRGNKYPQRLSLHANELIALSDFIQAEFKKNFEPKPAYVIPPGINPQHLPPRVGPKDIDLLAAGSLIPLKQYELFIRAVAEIKKTMPEVKAVLIGDGVERKNLEELIAQHSPQDNVTLVGDLSHSCTVAMMQRAKVFLHPSSYEGFGVVCLEALYAGAHVISFVQPMNEKIRQWHVVKTIEEMINTAMQILQNPASLFESHLPFSMEETARKIGQLFMPEER